MSQEKKEEKKVSRRSYLKYAGAGVVVVAVAGVGGYYATLPAPAPPTPSSTTVPVTTAPVTTASMTPTYTLKAFDPRFQSWLEGTATELEDLFSQATIDWTQAKGQTVKLICMTDHMIDPLLDLVPIFQAHTGITVIPDRYAETELRDKTYMDLMTGTGLYDVVYTGDEMVNAFAKPHVIEDISPMLKDTSVTDTKFTDPSDVMNLDPCRYLAEYGGDNDIYMWPISAHSTILNWHKAKLAENGLSGPPETFDQLMDYASKCKRSDKGYYGFCMRGKRGQGTNMYLWPAFLWGFGGRFFDEKYVPQLDKPEAIQATKFYADILINYGPPGTADYDFSEDLTETAQGKVAMSIDDPVLSAWLFDPTRSTTVGEWWFGTHPGGPAGWFPAEASWDFAISTKSKAKTASWLLLQFWASVPSLSYTHMTTYHAANRKSCLDNPGYKQEFAKYNNLADVYAKSIAKASPTYRPKIPEWKAVGDTMGAYLSSAIAGEISAEAANKGMQTDVYAIMEKAGYYK